VAALRPAGAERAGVRRADGDGAVVVGRKTFDYAGHWGGDHHGVPIFVPTRGTPPEPQSGWVHYVPDAATAMREAKAAAGDQDVTVHGAGRAQSLLREGLLDELEIHLIPVVLGDGRRLSGADRIELEKAGAPVVVRGFGMLFDDRQPDGNKIEER
jgi:dihydrofolate reductase